MVAWKNSLSKLSNHQKAWINYFNKKKNEKKFKDTKERKVTLKQ